MALVLNKQSCIFQKIYAYDDELHILERFEAFTVMKIQVQVFLVVIPLSSVVGYQCFRGPCCLHHQGEDGGSMDFP
jgi:hypothetical protein